MTNKRTASALKRGQSRPVRRDGGTGFDVYAGAELDLHGMTVDEALPLIDDFIHRAFTSGYFTVRIVHGKGSGILRREVDRYLSSHPLVHAHTLADRYHGGDGATQVTLSE
jgi:DNA-nicking Smr family endonuclease